jgi:hypothetical protein
MTLGRVWATDYFPNVMLADLCHTIEFRVRGECLRSINVNGRTL